MEIATPPPAAAEKGAESAGAPTQRVEFRLLSKMAEEPGQTQ